MPRKSTIVSGVSPGTAATRCTSCRNPSAYHRAMSRELLIASGRALGERSNAPLPTAAMNRCSAATMCQARSSALLTIVSGRKCPCPAGIASITPRVIGCSRSSAPSIQSRRNSACSGCIVVIAALYSGRRMPEWTVTAAEAGERLDKFLAAANRAGSRAKAVDALDKRKVFLNDRELTRADAGVRVAAGDVVRLWMDRPGSARRRAPIGERRDLPIVYEDDQIVVLNKPPGLLAVP